MAKRQRGSSRPGQRRPTQRQSPARPASPAPSRPATGLSEAEEERAAELEAQIVAEERRAETVRSGSRERSRSGFDAVRGRGRESGLLAARAAEEYTYVARDVRRIVTVGGTLLGVMLAIWLIVEVLHIVAF